jgi:Leucine-rich repeat (LRR) protein
MNANSGLFSNRFLIVLAMCVTPALMAPGQRSVDNSINNYEKITHESMPHNVRETFPTLMDITKKLTKLYVSGHHMRLTAEVFNGATNLEMVDLSHGEIAEIESRAFYGAPKLKKLNLSGNNLKALPVEMFPQRNVLKEINLSHNKIEKINRATFKDLQHLKKLDLRNNNLKSLDGFVFADLINLQELDLTGNPIRSISEEFFASLPSGLALSFDDHSLDFKSLQLADQWSI